MKAHFIQFPTDIYEAVMSRPFTLRQLKVICAIVRFTYGYQRQAAKIPIEKLCAITRLARPHIYAARAELVAANVVAVDGELVSINNDLSTWKVSESSTKPVSDESSTKSVSTKTRKQLTKTTTSVQNSATIYFADEYRIGSKASTESVVNQVPNRYSSSAVIPAENSENFSENQSPEISQFSPKTPLKAFKAFKENLKDDDDKESAHARKDKASSSSGKFFEKRQLPKDSAALLDVWNAAFPEKKVPAVIPEQRFNLLITATEFLKASAGDVPWPVSAETEDLVCWLEDVLEYAKKQPYTKAANFDWLLQPQYLTRLVEGAYAPRH